MAVAQKSGTQNGTLVNGNMGFHFDPDPNQVLQIPQMQCQQLSSRLFCSSRHCLCAAPSRQLARLQPTRLGSSNSWTEEKRTGVAVGFLNQPKKTGGTLRTAVSISETAEPEASLASRTPR